MSDQSSSEEDGVSLAGSDFEYQLKSSQRKSSGSQGAVSPGSVTGSCSRPPRPLPVTSAQVERHASASHLYDAVRSGRSALTTLVDDWLEEYGRDREAAFLELINFVVQSSGCKGVVSREMLRSLQNADIISHLTQKFNEDSCSYPLVCVGPQWRLFREGVCELVSLLVRGSRNSLLYDDFLFSSFIALLTGLADSQVRAFRHTSTFIAMQLMSSLVVVAADVNVQSLMIWRRLELEKNKAMEERAIDREEELENIHRELLEHQEDLRSMMSGIFKGVFVHRYRDVLPEIRAVCMRQMGVWLRLSPAHFLNDEHLKYLGWMLHDKQAPVRLQCVLSLQKLYEEKDFISRLEFFTSRFKERLLSMVLDKDSEVAVEAVKLLLLIQQQTEEGLSSGERAGVFPLVFATHRGLARAAGAFLYHTLSSAAEKHSDQRRLSILHLLALFFTQSQYHEHAAYLVDSLWEVAEAELKDWEMMTSLLLQDNALPEDLEGAVIDIMVCAVRQAAEATPPSVGTHRKNLSGKQKRLQAQDQRRITNHFIPVLPQLLGKFSADAGKVSLLLRVPLCFQLELYGASGRLEKYLDALLAQVCEVLLKLREQSVCEACVRVLGALCSMPHSFCARAERAVSRLLDSVVERLRESSQEILQGSADDDDLYTAASSLNILAVFSSARDLTEWNLFEVCFQLLKKSVEMDEVHHKVLVPALSCSTFHLLWEGKKISQQEVDKAEGRSVLKALRSLTVVCQSCLSLPQSPIRNQAFVCVCDLLLVFSSVCAGSAALRFTPDESLSAELMSFVLDYIFSDHDEASGEEEGDEEMKISSLLQKRNQLAGFCKLIIHGVLDLCMLTDILKHYHRFYKDFGDIIKEVLNKSKMMSSEESARTVCMCLQQMFSSSEQSCSDLDLSEIRLLAKKLALNFGINLKAVQPALVTLHREGIRFSTQGLAMADQKNLSFLEILSEFSFKLLPLQRKQLLQHLHKTCSSVLSNSFVNMYHRSLMSGSKEATHTPVETPVRKRRRMSGLPAAVEPPRPPPDSDEEFTDGRGALRRRQSSSVPSSLQSRLSTMSLGAEAVPDEEDDDEGEIEDFSDEDDSEVALPSTHGSSFLEDLFE